METSELKDRVVGIQRVRAKNILPNPLNFRIHPDKQKDILKGMLGEIGIADTLLVRKLEDGRVVLINGHMRQGMYPPEQKVPVVVVDLTEEEANTMLAAMDPLAGMAETDKKAQKKLIKNLKPGDEILTGFFAELTPTKKGKDKELGLDVQGSEEPTEEGEEVPEVAPVEEATGASQVRMVQLFFNSETQPVYNKMIEILNKAFDTFNPTDCVFRALKECVSRFGGDENGTDSSESGEVSDR